MGSEVYAEGLYNSNGLVEIQTEKYIHMCLLVSTIYLYISREFDSE